MYIRTKRKSQRHHLAHDEIHSLISNTQNSLFRFLAHINTYTMDSVCACMHVNLFLYIIITFTNDTITATARKKNWPINWSNSNSLFMMLSVRVCVCSLVIRDRPFRHAYRNKMNICAHQTDNREHHQQQQQHQPPQQRLNKTEKRNKWKHIHLLIKYALIHMWTKALNINWSTPFIFDKMYIRVYRTFVGLFSLYAVNDCNVTVLRLHFNTIWKSVIFSFT